MTAFGVSAYRRTGIDTGVAAASPHQLVLMLFDAALEAIRQAEVHLKSGEVAAKGAALGKAVRIVEEGLKASVDRGAGGALAEHLASLYDYATLRLLQANLRNDDAALREVNKLLSELREAWAQIGSPRTATPAAAPAGADSGPRASSKPVGAPSETMMVRVAFVA
jgi:flagellar protein FliS